MIEQSHYHDDVPDWAWDIVEKHDLGLRSDSPSAAVIVLLSDAAAILKEASLTAFREQAISGDLRQRMAACQTMIADATKLMPLCPGTPLKGTVLAAKDGTLTWSPS